MLGIIADRAALKKTLMAVYAAAGSLFVVLAFFSAYTSHPWAWLLGTFIVANVGFAGSLVFYNSLLPHVAPRGLLDDVSSRGYAYGYVGGGLLLLVHLALNLAARDTDASDLVTRGSIASIGVWWFGWAVWTLKVVPEPSGVDVAARLTVRKAVSVSVAELVKTFREIGRFRVVLVYLGAFLLFNDGIQTVIAIAGAFAADTLGIPLAFNMLTILLIQFVAAGGAMVFAWLSARITTKGALTVALVGWILVLFAGVAVAPLVPADGSDFDYRLTYRPAEAAYFVDSAPEVEDSRSEVLWRQEGHAVEQRSSSFRPRRPRGLWHGVRQSTALRVRGLDRGRRPGRRDRGRRPAPVDPWGRPDRLVAPVRPGQAVGAPGTERRLPVAGAGRVGRPGARRQPGARQEPLRADHARGTKRRVLLVLRFRDTRVGRVRPDALRVRHRRVRHPGRRGLHRRHHSRGHDRAARGRRTCRRPGRSRRERETARPAGRIAAPVPLPVEQLY